ncbi:amidohydrolase family protein [Flagellimonas marinaquae]|uniref:amidohydrolase family protein n=1 Tax=Flagellimonas marinaquae TaxID=254955 RepID=UPI002075C370|nr:amidohydrolase family protein [Allomuricauda aquimarina]USD25932.1 amidohydrolase family protein [Allomuricauda aquimarina]
MMGNTKSTVWKTTRYALCSLILILGGCNGGVSENKNDEASILIESVTVIDAKSGERANLNVLLTGNKIMEVSKKPIAPPSNSTVIDGKGKYLIPGLWDAHVHLTFTPGLEQAMFPLFLGNGITSIRDTGGLMHKVLPWKEKSIQEPDSSPRLFIAGPLLDGLPNVYDGNPGRPEISVGLGSEEEAIAMVDSLAAAGVDLIKAYEMLNPEMFKTIVAAAKKHNLPVTGHVPLSVDAIEASEHGLRSMEHMRNLEMSCSSDHDSLLRARKQMLAKGKGELGGVLRSAIHTSQRLHAFNTFDQQRAAQVLAALKKNGTWQIPTVTLSTGGINRLYENGDWRKTFEYLPETIKSNWKEAANKATEKMSNELSVAHGEWVLKMVKRLKKADVKVMAGTDTPIGFLTPGFSLHKELEMLVKGGMEPLEAIASATLLPSQYFKLQDSIGTIEKNMIADLVLLDANPLSDITNTRLIRAVVRNGTYYDRKALDGLLNGN